MQEKEQQVGTRANVQLEVQQEEQQEEKQAGTWANVKLEVHQEEHQEEQQNIDAFGSRTSRARVVQSCSALWPPRATSSPSSGDVYRVIQQIYIYHLPSGGGENRDGR